MSHRQGRNPRWQSGNGPGGATATDGSPMELTSHPCTSRFTLYKERPWVSHEVLWVTHEVVSCAACFGCPDRCRPACLRLSGPTLWRKLPISLSRQISLVA